MGLDMYLYLEKGYYNSQYSKDIVCEYPQELKDFEKEIEERNFKSIETRTSYQVGYWRKANAIHSWIVDNCADGVDECQKIYLEEEKVKTLIDLCEQVLNDHSKASKLLPTQSGFFFGDLEYDDWYFNYIDYTKHILTKVLEKYQELYSKNNSFNTDYYIVYQASW